MYTWRRCTHPIIIKIFILNIAMLGHSFALTSIKSTNIPNPKNATVPQIIIEIGTEQILQKLQQDAAKQNIAQYPLGQIMTWVALQLVNQPYVGSLLDLKQPEYLYISLTKTDCMLFVEEVLVVSRLIKMHQLTLPNLIAGIKQVRYHDNISYCLRNHYFKDWAITNIQKQLVVDEAYKLTHVVYPYKAQIMGNTLKNSAEAEHSVSLACILKREQYINSPASQLGFIPLKLMPRYLSKFQNGDIIGIVRSPGKSDAIHHLGIVYINKDGHVGMIHASSVSSLRKVVIALDLMDYLAQFKDSQGVILLRPL